MDYWLISFIHFAFAGEFQEYVHGDILDRLARGIHGEKSGHVRGCCPVQKRGWETVCRK